jgi:competence protein ComEC
MRLALLLFCAGIASAVFVENIPLSVGRVSLSLGFVVFLSCCHRFYPASFVLKMMPVLCFPLLGLLWHLLWAQSLLNKRLPEELEGVTLHVAGVVVTLPEKTANVQQFEFRALESDSDFLGRNILLNYYGDIEISPGQYWQFSLRLNRPHGFANPGGFDYEGWLFQRGISAKGYVRNSMHNKLLRDTLTIPLVGNILLKSMLLINTGRYRLKLIIERLLSDSPYIGLVLALTLGDKSEISQTEWQLFSATGSNHLFVISGLHIGMIAGFFYWLLLKILSRLPCLTDIYPLQKFAAFISLFAALFYSLLAGFTLPTQRALVMLAVFVLGGLSNRRFLVSFRYLLALTIVLLLNPLAIINSGFWFSFVAVGALLLFLNHSDMQIKEWCWKDVVNSRFWVLCLYVARPQFVVFLALFLPLLFWTQQVSLIAPIVNLIAIPVVGFIIVPLLFLALLIALISTSLSAFLINVAVRALVMLLAFMEYLVDRGGDVFLLALPAMSNWQLVSLVIAIALLLMPRGVPGRRLIPILSLPLFLSFISGWLPVLGAASKRSVGEFVLHFHIADVGQGLAVIVDTGNHALVYDAGASFSPDFNMGSAVLLPTLRFLGIERLDSVIISHGDNDHAGGLVGLENGLEIRRLISNDLGLRSGLKVNLCSEIQPWVWDGVEFRFLQTGLHYDNDNNNSCVLQIMLGEAKILLSGDIEREAEMGLVLRYGKHLKSTVLLAPHHGSDSSSSYALLKNTRPDYVVFSAGYNNSFDHPSDKVVARYQEFGVVPLYTATSGMISFEYSHRGEQMTNWEGPKFYREEKFRYWHAHECR